LVLFALIGAGILVALNSAYNVGALLIAGGVLGQLFLTQIRDQAEKSFRAARAEREDFEADRSYELLVEDQKLRKLELFLKLNPMPSDEQKKVYEDLLLSPEETEDKTE
jgi:ribosomal 30S subunit maturation factor RimM